MYLFNLPSRRSPVEGTFSPDGLFEARFRVGNTPNLREGEQLPMLPLMRPWRKRAAERDDELLSAYLDGMLSAEERAALEARLEAEPALRQRLEAMRQTVALLRQLPPVPAPRNFLLTPAMVQPRPRPRPRPRTYPLLRWATVVAAFLWLLVVGVDLGTRTLGPVQAPVEREMALGQKEVESAQPFPAGEEVGAAPEATVVIVEKLAEKAVVSPSPPAAVPTDQEPLPKQAFGPEGEERATALPEAEAPAEMPGPATEVPSEAFPSPLPTPSPEAQKVAPTPSPAPTVVAAAPPAAPSPAPVEGSRAPLVRRPLWRGMEIGLGLAVILLAIATWFVRRRTGGERETPSNR